MRKERRLLICVNCLFALYVVFLHWFVFKVVAVNPDAGYYASIADAIRRGLIPYRDIQLSYTPLSIYLLSLGSYLFRAFPISEYESYVATLLTAQYLSAFVLYRISLRFVSSRAVAVFLSLLMLASFAAYEGIYLVLEPFVVLFSLLALNRCLSERYLSAGICAGLSFFAKQYGLAVVLPLIVFIAGRRGYSRRKKLYSLAKGISGFLLPCVFFLYYFVVINGVSTSELLPLVSANSYQPFPRIQWRSVVGFMFQQGIPLLFAPFAFFFMASEKKPDLAVLIAAGICYFPQMWFAQFEHYFLNIIPFTLLLGLFVAEWVWKRGDARHRAVAAVVAGYLAVLSGGGAYNDIVVHKRLNYRMQQQAAAQVINRYASRGSEVLVIGNSAYYYLCGFRPTLDGVQNFAFARYYSVETLTRWLIEQQLVLTEPSSGYFYNSVARRFAERGQSLEEFFKESGFVKTAIKPSGFVLWMRTKGGSRQPHGLLETS